METAVAAGRADEGTASWAPVGTSRPNGPATRPGSRTRSADAAGRPARAPGVVPAKGMPAPPPHPRAVGRCGKVDGPGDVLLDVLGRAARQPLAGAPPVLATGPAGRT